MKQIINSFSPYVLLIIIYRVLLDIIYEKIIVNYYDYQNYIYNPSDFSIFISWLFFVSFLPFFQKSATSSKLSNLISFLFILFSVVPTTTMIAYNSNYSFLFIFLIYIYWLLFFKYLNLIPTIYINIKYKSSLIFNFLLYIIVCALLYISYVYTGFRFHFGLMDVYDLRLEARGYSPPLLLSYLLSAADYVLIFVLIYFLSKKRYVISVIIFILNLLNFGISGSKHIVFLLFLSLLVYFSINTKDVKKYILPFIISILILSIIENYFFETVFLTLFLSYRVLIIPSKLHYIYYDYFSNHEFDYFRQSFLKFFIESPYKDNIGFIISEYDTGDVGGRANNGLFSDAYFNLGVIGVLLFPLILAILLKLFDGAAKNLNARMYFSIALSIFLAFLSLPLTTAILSSGLLFFLILLYFVPFEKQ